MPTLCSSFSLSIDSPFALNFVQTGRVSIEMHLFYFRVIRLSPPALFTLVDVKVTLILLKYVRDRQIKTRCKMAAEQSTSPKPTYIFIIWLHQFVWRLAVCEGKDSCFCSHPYSCWSRHFVIRGHAKKTSWYTSRYRVVPEVSYTLTCSVRLVM